MKHVRIDEQGRAVLGKLVRPGERYAVETATEGVLVLRRHNAIPSGRPRVKLERQGGRTFLVGSRPLTLEDVQRALESFP